MDPSPLIRYGTSQPDYEYDMVTWSLVRDRDRKIKRERDRERDIYREATSCI